MLQSMCFINARYPTFKKKIRFKKYKRYILSVSSFINFIFKKYITDPYTLTLQREKYNKQFRPRTYLNRNIQKNCI